MKKPLANALPLNSTDELYRLLNSIQGKDSMWKVVNYVRKDQKRFDALMDYVYHPVDFKEATKAGWAIGKIGEIKPEFFEMHHVGILKAMREQQGNFALLRNLIRNYQYIPIPESIVAELYDFCLNLVQNPSNPAAVRAFSITVCGRICLQYPALIREFKMAIEEHGMNAEAAIRVRCRRVLKQMEISPYSAD